VWNEPVCVLECGFEESRKEGATECAVGIPNIGIEDDWLSSLSSCREKERYLCLRSMVTSDVTGYT
jgi:hypothetical protein